MTVIDDILEGLRPKSSVFCRMRLSNDWGFAKDALAGAPFYLLLSGSAGLEKEGLEQSILLGPGDFVILPPGERHRLLSHPNATTVPFLQLAEETGLLPWRQSERYKAIDLPYISDAPVTTLLSGVYAFRDHRRSPLLDALPSVLLMRANTDSAAARTVASIASLLDAALLSGNPGAESIGGRLADILFALIVRHYLSSGEVLPRGWLRGATDAQIAPALAAMHRAPEKPWSVAALAREVGMSRSRFAARFHDVVGQSPLDYLTQWRMYEAAGRLAEGKVPLPALANLVGYRSEISFSKAFKRWAGRPPADYRRWISQQIRLDVDT